VDRADDRRVAQPAGVLADEGVEVAGGLLVLTLALAALPLSNKFTKFRLKFGPILFLSFI